MLAEVPDKHSNLDNNLIESVRFSARNSIKVFFARLASIRQLFRINEEIKKNSEKKEKMKILEQLEESQSIITNIFLFLFLFLDESGWG